MSKNQPDADLELSEEDIKKVKALAKEMNLEEFSTFISGIVRAFEGKPINPEELILKLINVKNILERTRFMTYPLLGRNVYLRLIAQKHSEATSCLEWANLEAYGLTSYKGLSRTEFVDMTKKAQAPEEQQQIFFPSSEVQKPKRRFFQRKPKKEKGEFKAD